MSIVNTYYSSNIPSNVKELQTIKTKKEAQIITSKEVNFVSPQVIKNDLLDPSLYKYITNLHLIKRIGLETLCKLEAKYGGQEETFRNWVKNGWISVQTAYDMLYLSTGSLSSTQRKLQSYLPPILKRNAQYFNSSDGSVGLSDYYQVSTDFCAKYSKEVKTESNNKVTIDYIYKDDQLEERPNALIVRADVKTDHNKAFNFKDTTQLIYDLFKGGWNVYSVINRCTDSLQETLNYFYDKEMTIRANMIHGHANSSTIALGNGRKGRLEKDADNFEEIVTTYNHVLDRKKFFLYTHGCKTASRNSKNNIAKSFYEKLDAPNAIVFGNETIVTSNQAILTCASPENLSFSYGNYQNESIAIYNGEKPAKAIDYDSKLVVKDNTHTFPYLRKLFAASFPTIVSAEFECR